MKIRILRDYDHPISPALTQAFKAETVVSVPKTTAEALICASVATKITVKPED